ncbi:MAG TPA: KOW domain-containing RNA-binding protein [Bacillota bacterium]|nr:KOW domain-containing RNA-binding protein [Bacillota bacterium]
MVDNKFEIGQLVNSIAGRDSKKFGLICEILSQSFVRVVDGESHRLEAPKKKNIKHLQGYPRIAAGLVNKWQEGQKVTDAEVKKAVEELRAGLGI